LLKGTVINEVPVSKALINDPTNTCAFMIKLPADICVGGGDDSLKCLGQPQQLQLEKDLETLVNNHKIVPGMEHIGNRPGSYMVVVREFDTNGNHKYQRQFFCENWSSPNGKFKLVFDPISGKDSTGVCYLEAAAKGVNSTVTV